MAKKSGKPPVEATKVAGKKGRMSPEAAAELQKFLVEYDKGENATELHKRYGESKVSYPTFIKKLKESRGESTDAPKSTRTTAKAMKPTGLTFMDMEEARALAEALGGFAEARKALEAVGKIGSPKAVLDALGAIETVQQWGK